MNFVSVMFRLILAMVCGGMIGLERGRKRRPAGFRTYMLVCLGAALTMLLSQYEFAMVMGPWNGIAQELGMKTDVSRFGAQVINGIGFLGAGTILVTGRQEVKGLTTAAGLWASACMGLAIGAGFYECVVLCTVLIFLCMRFLPAFENYLVEKARFINIYVEFRSLDDLGAIINLDDFTHIECLEKTIGTIPETICCRFNPGGDFVLENEIMDTPQEAKYGMTREQLIEAFKYMKQKGVKHFGIHAFLASNTVANEYYPALARILFKLAVEVQKETGVHIAFINLSGGVGIPYKPWQEPNDIMAIGEGVHRAFDEVLVPAGMDDVSIYTEMGRFILGPYGALVAKCIHHKHTYKEYAGLDACAANLMRPAMYGAYHHITVLGKENALHDRTYDVTGGLCENNDKFAVDRNLPRIDIGDYVYIHDTGAHGFSMGYNYNGKLRSAELLLREDGSVEMIRRAETPKDYFATFDFTGLFDDIK